MPIVQQRPATIASTAAEGRRRLGGQSPSHARGNANKHPLPKVRASTASLSPAVDGALLPQIVSAPRAVSPRKKSVPQHSSHEAPRSPAKRNQKRPSAVPSPASTPRAAAAAAAAAAHRARCISHGSDVPPAARAAPASPQLPAGAPTRQRRSNAAADAVRPGQYRRKPIAHAPKRSGLPSKKGAEVAEEEEEEEEEEESALSADDALLLCGVQPGSAKALWFTSLLSQLDSRRDLSAALDTADLQEQQRSSTENAVLRAAAPSMSALPVLHASGVTVVSPPLQLPAKLLEEEEPRQRVAPPSDYAAPPVHEDTLPLASHPDAKPHSSAYETASSASSSSETASEAQSVASHTVHSAVETDDDDDDDDCDEEDVSDDDEPEETDSASSRDEQHEPRFHRGNSNYHNTGDEDAGDEEGSQLPSPKKFADATKRPMSEAANLLAQLRAAVAHRKSEQLPEGVTELHLRALRLTRQQIEQSRVHVLSLEKEESD